MTLMSVCLTLFKLTQHWNTKNLYLTLEKGDPLFKSMKQFCYLAADDLTTKINIEGIALMMLKSLH